MIVCPLCEHQQAVGDACDVCGRPFPAAMAIPVPVPPTEGLEPTRYDPVPTEAGPPGLGVLPELEPTRFEDTLALPEDVDGLEPTRQASIAEVPVETVPDLERTAEALPGDERTPFPALVTCRYCRNPAAPGERLCAHCGMRLPVVRPPEAGGGAAAESTRLCGCGTRVRGSVCPTCGARAG